MLRNILQNTKFILLLILAAFFLKGLFVAAAHPVFDGQDEGRHYNSIQYLNEPKNKTWKITEKKSMRNKENISDYNFSEEMIKSGQAADFDKWRHSLYETVDFSKDYDGKNEKEIGAMKWKPYNYLSPPDVVSKSLYHTIGSKIEKLLQDRNILVRFYSIRIFSVLLGVLAILFAYLIIKNIGFSPKHTLLLTAIIALQPKLGDYMTNINYDVITISMFFLFTLGGVLALKNGLRWKNLLVMLLAAYLSFQTKGTGIVLFAMLGFLLLYFFRQKIKDGKPHLLRAFYILSPLAAVASLFYFKKYLPLQNDLSTVLLSLIKYLDESLTLGRFALSSRTYWGSLGWVDSWTLSNFTDIIWVIETFALIGLILYFISKSKPAFLPEKKYMVFLIGMIVSLQLGIRAFDWNVYSATDSLDLGTPGRYFLPNLASHLILVFTGLGMFLHTFGQGKHFKTILSAGLILMFSLSMYLIFDVILYRFYL